MEIFIIVGKNYSFLTPGPTFWSAESTLKSVLWKHTSYIFDAVDRYAGSPPCYWKRISSYVSNVYHPRILNLTRSLQQPGRVKEKGISFNHYCHKTVTIRRHYGLTITRRKNTWRGGCLVKGTAEPKMNVINLCICETS